VRREFKARRAFRVQPVILELKARREFKEFKESKVLTARDLSDLRGQLALKELQDQQARQVQPGQRVPQVLRALKGHRVLLAQPDQQVCLEQVRHCFTTP
jgi:hypothetical protein